MSKINSMNKFPTFWGDENPWFPFVPSKNGPIDDAHHVVPEVLILATLHDTFPMPKEVKTVPWWNRSEPWWTIEQFGGLPIDIGFVLKDMGWPCWPGWPGWPLKPKKMLSSFREGLAVCVLVLVLGTPKKTCRFTNTSNTFHEAFLWRIDDPGMTWKWISIQKTTCASIVGDVPQPLASELTYKYI